MYLEVIGNRGLGFRKPQVIYLPMIPIRSDLGCTVDFLVYCGVSKNITCLPIKQTKLFALFAPFLPLKDISVTLNEFSVIASYLFYYCSYNLSLSYIPSYVHICPGYREKLVDLQGTLKVHVQFYNRISRSYRPCNEN